MSYLIYIRRILALLVGATLLLLFVDPTHSMPAWTGRLADVQFTPLLIQGLALAVAAWLVLTLLAGRLYCSVICPLGILQDVIGRVKRWTTRSRKKRRMKYRRPLNILRFGILGAVALGYLIGTTLPLTLLDPYSIFGRIAVGLLRPMAGWINNTLAGWLNAAGNYALYVVPELPAGQIVAISSGVVVAALIVMVWRAGRLWCNTLCPVGALLGLVSRFSWLRIRIDAKCNHCGNCEAACKAQCIDAKAGTVDASRCVDCFNCLGSCPKKAIAFRAEVGGRKSDFEKDHLEQNPELRTPNAEFRSSRRRFLKGSLATLAALPAARLMAWSADAPSRPAGRRTKYAMPPGAVSRDRFVRSCTACQLCVAACPTGVLRPATFENGLSGVMQPYMHFRVESFCNYECRACIDACPNQAITPLTTEQKKLTRVGDVRFLRNRCVVKTKHQDCGACAEHCPTGAVHMVPYGDTGLTIPKVEPEFCIGCGGCESICPVQPHPAIYVQGLDIQQEALPPASGDPAAETITDFGF